MQVGICKGNANGSTLPTANKTLFTDLLLFTSGEGDEATSPSFEAENEAINASNESLEALIATRYMQMGCDGSTLQMANRYLFADPYFYKWRGRRGNVALFSS